MDDASTLLGSVSRGPVRRVLVVLVDDTVATHELPATGEVIIGRGSGAAIRVDHASVSRAHVALELGDVVRIRDLESGNGTALRGAQLPAHQAVEIGVNETFQLGDVAVVVQERRTARPQASRPSGPSAGLVGQPIIIEPAMQNLFELARRVAVGSINVLVVGESGTGKDVLATAIHAASSRSAGPMIPINCAAMTDSLIESELFGHERGSFTGATGAKPGLLEAAHGGTVFLDEVGELSAAAQAKLLRVIEDRRVQRVGAVTLRAIDVRFVAATNRDLEVAAAAGEFRTDLYYRLAGIVLEVPPLRERQREIEPLARAFARASAVQLGRPVPQLEPAAIAALAAHDWPGNVRELRNVIERAVLLAQGAITPADLFGHTTRTAPAPSVAFDDERARIVAALDRCAGNQTRAAAALGMPRRTLVKRLAQYAIPRPKRG